jgi:hypothetical protein
LCAGAGQSPGRGGGRGWRNQFHATGLTGWQRVARADAQAAEPIGSSPEPFARLDEKLTEVAERLERLQSAERD